MKILLVIVFSVFIRDYITFAKNIDSAEVDCKSKTCTLLAESMVMRPSYQDEYIQMDEDEDEEVIIIEEEPYQGEEKQKEEVEDESILESKEKTSSPKKKWWQF